jgi:hypothetical protein
MVCYCYAKREIASTSNSTPKKLPSHSTSTLRRVETVVVAPGVCVCVCGRSTLGDVLSACAPFAEKADQREVKNGEGGGASGTHTQNAPKIRKKIEIY